MTDNILQEGPILFIDVSENAEQNRIVEIASETLPSPQETQQFNPEVNNSDPCLQVQRKRVRCLICKRYSAENEEKMLRHVRKVHRGEHPFQCYMCDYSTYNKSLFEDHVRMHQGIKPFKCSHCPYRSVSKKNTKKHEQIHRPDNPLGCSQCPFIARNGKSLNSHIQKNHFESIENGGALKCTKCNTTFSDEEAYNLHITSKRQCSNCDVILCKQLLKKHKREVHGLVSQKKEGKVRQNNLKCKVCKWSTNSKPRFLLHLIHHPDQDLSGCNVDLSVLRKYGILPEVVDNVGE